MLALSIFDCFSFFFFVSCLFSSIILPCPCPRAPPLLFLSTIKDSHLTQTELKLPCAILHTLLPLITSFSEPKPSPKTYPNHSGDGKSGVASQFCKAGSRRLQPPAQNPCIDIISISWSWSGFELFDGRGGKREEVSWLVSFMKAGNEGGKGEREERRKGKRRKGEGKERKGRKASSHWERVQLTGISSNWSIRRFCGYVSREYNRDNAWTTTQ